MKGKINDPFVVAHLTHFQDALANMQTAMMLAADLYLHGKAAAEVKRNGEGHVVEFVPLDVTTVFMTSDHEGNTVYQQVIPERKIERDFLARDMLYITRNRFS